MSKTTPDRQEKALIEDCKRYKDCTKKRMLKRTNPDKRYNHYSNAHVKKMKDIANIEKELGLGDKEDYNKLTTNEAKVAYIEDLRKKNGTRQEKLRLRVLARLLMKKHSKPYHPLGFTNLRY